VNARETYADLIRYSFMRGRLDYTSYVLLFYYLHYHWALKSGGDAKGRIAKVATSAFGAAVSGWASLSILVAAGFAGVLELLQDWVAETIRKSRESELESFESFEASYLQPLDRMRSELGDEKFFRLHPIEALLANRAERPAEDARETSHRPPPRGRKTSELPARVKQAMSRHWADMPRVTDPGDRRE
jgi:hypothetical protein